MLKNMEQLEKNIVEQIKEAQLKLGFIKETMRLYYPLESLNTMLDTSISQAEEMCQMLTESCPRFTFGTHQGRIEVSVPPDYVEYVHREVETPKFLSAMIKLFQNDHHLKLSQIEELFSRSGRYVCEKMPEGTDFDYVLYFEDAAVDEYYYCIKMEMGHTIYHRFLKTDYLKML